MEYMQSVQYIHSLLKFGIKPGLERIESLLESLNNPQDDFKCFHVAGTNGKGSTCAMLHSVCVEAGYKTGLFISPFVIDFCERIQINKQFISHSDLAEAVAIVKAASDKLSDDLKPTEFEFITAVAFKYFSIKKCEIAVIETGLGGRLDSTNVIKSPLATVLTKIDMDHMDILGDTVEKIAYEKCGIIKTGCPVLFSPTQEKNVQTVIKTIANQKAAPLFESEYEGIYNIKSTIDGTTFSSNDLEIFLPLLGEHQIDNAMLALAALNVSKLEVSKQDIIFGLQKVSFPARLEIISKNPTVILDGAHNLNGSLALKAAIENFGLHDITAIIGMMKDKDIDGVLNNILPFCQNVITVTVTSNSRSIEAEHLLKKAKKYCENCCAASSYFEALLKPKLLANKNPIVIFGSLYLAGDIREIAQKEFNSTT
ncbi:MAG: folylpolyglutamate synthase/dihydrofolate synthase family protein [Oscillospiraceae bacterium]